MAGSGVRGADIGHEEAGDAAGRQKSTPTSRSARPSTSRKATGPRRSRRTRRSDAPGRRSTRIRRRQQVGHWPRAGRTRRCRAKKGGRIGGAASANRPGAKRTRASARKAAATRKSATPRRPRSAGDRLEPAQRQELGAVEAGGGAAVAAADVGERRRRADPAASAPARPGARSTSGRPIGCCPSTCETASSGLSHVPFSGGPRAAARPTSSSAGGSARATVPAQVRESLAVNARPPRAD